MAKRRKPSKKPAGLGSSRPCTQPSITLLFPRKRAPQWHLDPHLARDGEPAPHRLRLPGVRQWSDSGSPNGSWFHSSTVRTAARRPPLIWTVERRRRRECRRVTAVEIPLFAAKIRRGPSGGMAILFSYRQSERRGGTGLQAVGPAHEPARERPCRWVGFLGFGERDGSVFAERALDRGRIQRVRLGRSARRGISCSAASRNSRFQPWAGWNPAWRGDLQGASSLAMWDCNMMAVDISVCSSLTAV